MSRLEAYLDVGLNDERSAFSPSSLLFCPVVDFISVES